MPNYYRVTQEQITRRAGVTQPTISRWQRGLRKLSPETEERVETALAELEEKQREAERAAAETDFLAKVGGAVLAEVVGILSAAGRSLPISEGK